MCSSRTNCGCPIVIAIAIILGIVIGILFFNGLIALGTIALPAIGAFGALAMTVMALIAGIGKPETAKCVCKYGTCIVIGSVVSILLAIVALVVTLLAGSIAAAILVGAIGAAFIVTLVGMVLFLLCLVRSNCRCRIECRD